MNRHFRSGRSVALRAAIALSALVTVVATRPAAAVENGPCTYTMEFDVPAAMRDGTVLRANVFTPDQPGTYPVLLQRRPYNKDLAVTPANPVTFAWSGYWASHCYIVVVQDVRGQYKSDGFFYTFRNEAEDGYDTIEWVAGLPKSNGKVGTWGISYPGATQLLPATLRPPHLTAIAPGNTSSDYHDGWTYEGGALDLSFAEDWPLRTIANSHVRRYPDGPALDAEMNQAIADEFTKWYWYLPLKDFPPLHPEDPRVAPYFFDWLRHPGNDWYWQQWSIRSRYEDITVPALLFDGWYDIFINGQLENFVGLRTQGGSKVTRHGTQLVIGPWVHLDWRRNVGAVDFGPEADNPVNEIQLRFFDYWLKGIENGVDKDAPVRIFVMGANKWRTSSQWPVPGTVYRKYYLHSGGSANTASGDGWLSTEKPDRNRRSRWGERTRESRTDSYQYDPRDPVPSIGGRFQSSVPGGPYDQRPLLGRQDVLVYTTPPLEKDVEVTGPITVTLYASSSAKDTDFTAKLDDVYPDGTSMLLDYGIQRARYRDSATRPTLIQPGRIYPYTIHIWPTSNLFKVGHRIRLEISSSNFPMFDRNPNTGHPFAQDAELQTADQIVHHDEDHPSHVTLPIVGTALE
jgi:uncharacterized protein